MVSQVLNIRFQCSALRIYTAVRSASKTVQVKQGQTCTCGVGHEGTETNFVKSPFFVAHALISKKRRYFLSLKIKKNLSVLNSNKKSTWTYKVFCTKLTWTYFQLKTQKTIIPKLPEPTAYKPNLYKIVKLAAKNNWANPQFTYLWGTGTCKW